MILSTSTPVAMNPRARRPRRGSHGFTLTELTVSLTAGLIVALGLIGLSREATNSFHEEVRIAAAESGSRTAIDRLRADLQRASFMSTANIQRDPLIATPPGMPNLTLLATSAFPALGKLAGIQLVVGGSKTATPLSNVQLPRPLNPDAMYIAGNMTSTDAFEVRLVDPPNGACQTIWLAVDSAAMWRILAREYAVAEGGAGTAGSANLALASAFEPVAGNRFIVRFADLSGRSQYVVTCPNPTGGASQAAPNPFLLIDSRTPILTTQQTQTQGGQGGYGTGTMVNPVSIVKWEITNALPAALQAQLPNADSNEYFLTRSFIDITSSTLASIPGTTEVITEYAVDLKFAFTADSSPLVLPNVAGTAPQPTLIAFDADSTNATWGLDVSGLPALPAPPQGSTTGPQRIRAVRIRLVTRSAFSDRTTNIQPAPANQQNQNFLYRYCTAPPGADGGTPDCTVANQEIWARARTVVTEISLPNQSRLFWL